MRSNLNRRAVARAGIVIAVESPTYFGILGSVASLGMKVIEIPTHPQEGMDLNELDRSIRKHRVKACITMTNCHNPLGFVMRDENKKALVELTSRQGVILIEDDVYADLAFDGPRPRTAKSFDKDGSVVLCSSFSKILSPGYRIGWVAGGRFRGEIERLQLLSTMAAPSLQQHVIAEFLESGGYDRHVKRLRTTIASQVEDLRQAAGKYLPEGTRISRPAGGYVLWVQLPGKIDALQLYQAALAEHISILPGVIFSSTGRYKNYMRINCGHRWSEAHDRALLTLGRLCDRAPLDSRAAPDLRPIPVWRRVMIDGRYEEQQVGAIAGRTVTGGVNQEFLLAPGQCGEDHQRSGSRMDGPDRPQRNTGDLGDMHDRATKSCQIVEDSRTMSARPPSGVHLWPSQEGLDTSGASSAWRSRSNGQGDSDFSSAGGPAT